MELSEYKIEEVGVYVPKHPHLNLYKATDLINHFGGLACNVKRSKIYRERKRNLTKEQRHSITYQGGYVHLRGFWVSPELITAILVTLQALPKTVSKTVTLTRTGYAYTDPNRTPQSKLAREDSPGHTSQPLPVSAG